MADWKPLEAALAAVPEELREKLRKAFEAPIGSAPLQPDRGYEEVVRGAALSGAFDPSALLDPTAPGDENHDLLERLLQDSVVTTQGGKRLWMLKEGPRKAVLQQLTVEDAKDQLNRLRRTEVDSIGEALSAQIKGEARPLHEQSFDELVDTVTVAEWLESTPLPHPRIDDSRRQLGLAATLRPFEQLLKQGFAGRVQELEQLRDFVGVQPPESFTGWGRRLVRDVQRALGKRSSDPFVIWGPGGSGKSTLVAQFVSEHVRQSEERRFPFAYLDFDRAAVAQSQPLTLLLEIAEQVRFQFPALELGLTAFTRSVRREVEDKIRHFRHRSESLHAREDDVLRDPATMVSAASELQALLSTVARGGRPFVVVLDTFEEVQRGGDREIDGVLAALRALEGEQGWPELRTVVVGRAPLGRQRSTAADIKLQDLNQEDALALLRKQLDAPAADLEAITRYVGRSPLTLKLAAGVIREDRGKTSLAELLKTDRGWWDRFRNTYDDVALAAVLYERNLEHIGDLDVKKLAYPGFVLRRITPDIIREVLAVPCGFGSIDQQRAEEIFEKLGREVALVDDYEGALWHRGDVRAQMLPMIRKKLRMENPEALDSIQSCAIRYYTAREPAADRAEELYHRLMLGEPENVIEKRWTDAAGTRLSSVADELEPTQRAWLLARLGRPLDGEQEKLLSDHAWCRYAEQRGRELVNSAGRPDEGLELLSSRRIESRPVSFEVLLGVAAYSVGRWTLADDTWGRALTRDANAKQRLEILRYIADLHLKTGRSDALTLYEQTARVADEEGSVQEQLESWTGVMAARIAQHLQPDRDVAGPRVEKLLDVLSLSAPVAPALLKRAAIFSPDEGGGRRSLVRYFSAGFFSSVNRGEAEAIRRLGLSGNFGEFEDPAMTATSLTPAQARQLGASIADLVEKADPRDLTIVKSLLVSRHVDWQMPCRYALSRSKTWERGKGLSDLAKRLLPGVQLPWIMDVSPLDASKTLVQFADDTGRLPQIFDSARAFGMLDDEGEKLHAAFAGWRRLLASIIVEELAVA